MVKKLLRGFIIENFLANPESIQLARSALHCSDRAGSYLAKHPPPIARYRTVYYDNVRAIICTNNILYHAPAILIFSKHTTSSGSDWRNPTLSPRCIIRRGRRYDEYIFYDLPDRSIDRSLDLFPL